jgi:hypothetical protein
MLHLQLQLRNAKLERPCVDHLLDPRSAARHHPFRLPPAPPAPVTREPLSPSHELRAGGTAAGVGVAAASCCCYSDSTKSAITSATGL